MGANLFEQIGKKVRRPHLSRVMKVSISNTFILTLAHQTLGMDEVKYNLRIRV